MAHDTSTGSVMGLPLPSKAKPDLTYAALELTRFVQGLGHNTISLEIDNEPATLALQDLITAVRTRLGFKTLVRDAAVESHASNGHAEKTVGLLRGLSNMFLDQALMAWSYVHASFILNRFSVKGGSTVHERSTGFRYSGKLAAFAEPVWGFRRGKAKGDRKWHRAMFLTKSAYNDMYVLMNEQGVWLTRSIRRNAKPWADERQLVGLSKGMPWDYQLGVLGTKTFPPAKQRNPKPAQPAEPVFEARESLAGNLAVPFVPAGSDGAEQHEAVPASVVSAAPSSRLTTKACT